MKEIQALKIKLVKEGKLKLTHEAKEELFTLHEDEVESKYNKTIN